MSTCRRCKRETSQKLIGVVFNIFEPTPEAWAICQEFCLPELRDFMTKTPDSFIAAPTGDAVPSTQVENIVSADNTLGTPEDKPGPIEIIERP